MTSNLTDHLDDIVDAPVVEVSEFSDAMFVLRHKDFVPIRQESGHGQQYVALVGRDTLVDLHGDQHFARRRMLSTLFTKATILSYEQAVLDPALHESLAAVEVEGGAPLDLLRWCRETFTHLMIRVVGLRDLDSAEKRQEFVDDFVLLERAGRSKYSTDPSALAQAGLDAMRRIKAKNFLPAWRAELAIVRREEAGERPDSPDNLVRVMARHRKHYAGWDDEVTLREAGLFMIASIGSTSNAVCHAVVDLLRWLGEHPDQRDRLGDPDFLARAFRESVRLHQTNVIYRTALADVVLPSGIEVPQGHLAMINRIAVNRELERWAPETRRFDPFREVAKPAHDFGLSFGEGPHSCIGRMMVLGERSDAVRAKNPRDGLAVMTLHALFAYGVALSAADPPRMYDDMSRESWQTVPATFTGRPVWEADAGHG